MPPRRLDLSVESAEERLRSFVAPLPAERKPLMEALGLVLAEAISAPYDLPRFSNSAMDGFALRSVDTASATPDHPIRLTMVGSIEAGGHWTRSLPSGSALRISTGAPIPPSADAVVPIEDVEVVTSAIEVRGPVPAGAHVRPQGEDLVAGTTVARPGVTIRPQEIALLSSLNVQSLQAIPTPRISIMSIGPELMPGAAPAQVGDANGPMLAGLALDMGARIETVAVCSGEPGELVGDLRELGERADMILTSGGISNGVADSLSEIVDRLPGIELWNLWLRPGKHFAAGRLGDTPILALPGNPVAAFVGFMLLGRPAIEQMSGRSRRPVTLARTESPLEGTAGRVDAIRGWARTDSEGVLRVQPVQNRGSGVISSLGDANCLILLGEDQDSVAYDETVEIRWIAYQ